MHFIDEVRFRVQAGRGGDGCVAFRREKYVPKGGPSGGDGGRGGSVVLVGDANLNTLYHLRFRQLHSAQNGRPGEGSNRTGRSGEDLVIGVPLGTEVYSVGEEEMLGEILEEGERLVVAEGGRGGRGNARFATPTHQAPRQSEPGEEGEERELRLELKLLADVGIVGLPNAGKSTFISRVSAARPKIADYPFTTLVPQLGVVGADGVGEPLVVADLPGLIEGAARGAGLGYRFLRHVERCRVLLHFVDLASGEASPGRELETIEGEMRAFGEELLERPRLVVGTKLDAAAEERRQELEQAAGERSLPYFEISAVSGENVDSLLAAVRRVLGEAVA
ncbi:MAG: GTPase ObgE [Thermoanaerobaculia bacterium]|nr:GTPase ObgE [Thermoanaerobaculia bacterium]